MHVAHHVLVVPSVAVSTPGFWSTPSQSEETRDSRGAAKKQVLGTGAAVNVTIWLFNIAMENGPFIDDLPIKNGDFPWLC